MDLALEDGLTTFHDFNLNMDLGDVNDQPLTIMQSSHTQYHTQMLFYFIMGNSQNFDVYDVMKFEKILKRLKKMIVANCCKQH